MRLCHSHPYPPLAFHYIQSSSTLTQFRCMAPINFPWRNGSMANTILLLGIHSSLQSCILYFAFNHEKFLGEKKPVNKCRNIGGGAGLRLGSHSTKPFLCFPCLNPLVTGSSGNEQTSSQHSKELHYFTCAVNLSSIYWESSSVPPSMSIWCPEFRSS